MRLGFGSGVTKAFRRALEVLQEIKRHERSLMLLDREAADVVAAEKALQQRVRTLWEGLEGDKDLLAASHRIQRWLAVEDEPDTALAQLTVADMKRRLAESRS
ncbi:hypothetical protein [Cupriavidus sp. TMH.W2]|uniref:hypothetical protein n=1 Tax=Cupriavidus sp. TMH.W2 TaxID=3434465 RepID=UPI003D786AB0